MRCELCTPDIDNGVPYEKTAIKRLILSTEKNMTIIECSCLLGRDRGIQNVAKPDKKFCFDHQITTTQPTMTEVGVIL